MLYQVGMAQLDRTVLSYDTDEGEASPTSFDYRHIALNDVSLQAKDICFHDGDMELQLVNGSLRERDRFELQRLSGRYRMDRFGFLLTDLSLATGHSHINGEVRLPWSIFEKDPTAMINLSMDASIGLEDVNYLAGDNFQLPSRRLVRYSLDRKSVV